MDLVAKRDRPRTVTSRKSIKYRRSEWRVEELELCSGEVVCRASALHMPGALLLWVGGGAAPRLAGLALGVPAPAREGGARAAALLGADAAGEPAGLARRLARALARPVHAAAGAGWDPALERALLRHLLPPSPSSRPAPPSRPAPGITHEGDPSPIDGCVQ